MHYGAIELQSWCALDVGSQVMPGQFCTSSTGRPRALARSSPASSCTKPDLSEEPPGPREAAAATSPSAAATPSAACADDSKHQHPVAVPVLHQKTPACLGRAGRAGDHSAEELMQQRMTATIEHNSTIHDDHTQHSPAAYVRVQAACLLPEKVQSELLPPPAGIICWSSSSSSRRPSSSDR